MRNVQSQRLYQHHANPQYLGLSGGLVGPDQWCFLVFMLRLQVSLEQDDHEGAILLTACLPLRICRQQFTIPSSPPLDTNSLLTDVALARRWHEQLDQVMQSPMQWAVSATTISRRQFFRLWLEREVSLWMQAGASYPPGPYYRAHSLSACSA